jgi:hypothetical protein
LEEYKPGGYSLAKRSWLEFYVKYSDVCEPYDIKWRVVNRGNEAREKNDLRGKLEESTGKMTRLEETKYKGTHHMECYAIKNDVVVGWDRMHVRVK